MVWLRGLKLDVAGLAGVPAQGAESVVLSIKATSPTGTGYLRAFAADEASPPGSILTYNSGETSGDSSVVKLSADGRIKIFASTGTHLGIDVFGYFSDDGDEGFVSQTSQRLFDTRGGSPEQLSADTTYNYQVAGQAGVPATGATSVVVNLKAATPQSNGYMRAWGDGAGTSAPVMNMTSGKNESATAVLKLAEDGTINILSTATTHLVVDVQGYFSSTSETWNYTYNGDGLRVDKTSPDAELTEFSWDTNAELPTLLAQHNDNATTYLIYGPQGLPIGEIDSDGTSRWYHLDQLGSVRSVTNASGNVIGQLSYDAYGNIANQSGSTTPILDYAGQYRDTETGFQYLRARYYDPTTAQFVSEDPLVNTTGEPYAYASNNPTNYTDPSGMIFEKVSRAMASPRVSRAMGNISAATGVAATVLAFVPGAQGVSLALGVVSLGTGAVATVGSHRNGDRVGTAIGMAAMVPGLGGVVRGVRGLSTVAGRHYRLGSYEGLIHRRAMDRSFSALYGGVSASFGLIGSGWMYAGSRRC